MKLLDYIILTPVIVLVAIGLINLENIWNMIFVFVIAIIILVYAIVAIVNRSKITRDNTTLLMDNIANSEEHSKCTIKLSKATAKIAKDAMYYEHEFDELEGTITELEEKVIKLEKVLDDSGIKLCDCGAIMRETKSYYICDECETRIKKPKKESVKVKKNNDQVGSDVDEKEKAE